ncbi:MAG TPA: hypothetical protein VF810_00185 [Patescibacteria group bacterium]
MKKLASVIAFITTSVSFLSITTFAYAAGGNICPTGQFSPLCSLRLDQGSSIVGRIVSILLIVAVVVALIFLIIGGLRWIMSGGDKSKVDSARSTVTGAVVGLVIALLAYFILNVVVFLFTKSSITNLSIPTIVP